MREKTDRSFPGPPSGASDAEPDGREASTEQPHHQAWIDAYHEAQRSMVEVQGAFQRAMTESHLAFLTAMEKSLAGLRALAGASGVEPPLAGPPPAEARPAETRPAEAWPAEARPAEARPAEARPAQAVPSWEPVPEPPAASHRAPAERRPEVVQAPGSTPGSTGKPWAVWDEPSEGKAGPAAAPPSRQPPAPSEYEASSPVPEPETPPMEPRQGPAAAADRAEAERPKPAFGRFALQAERAAPVGLAMSGLATASPLVVTDEGTGIARGLVEQLQARGVAAKVVSEIPPGVSGAVLLGGLRPVGSLEDTKEVNREAFRAAKALARRFTTGRGVFVTVQDTGGDFGLSGIAGERAGLGGLAALAKSAHLEWPGVTVKAVDLERGGRPAWKLAKLLAEELFDGGPELEVGLQADGRRVTLKTYQALLNLGGPNGVYSMVNRSFLRQSSVIVASGGARGITAAVLIALARNARPRMAILGRSALGEEPDWLASIDGAEDLRRALAGGPGKERAGTEAEEIDREIRRILAGREIRANLAALSQAGSEVVYHAVDVRDREAVARCLSEVREEWGPLTGLVHGAGIHSERLLVDKTLEDFDRVFGTKVDGLVNLLHATSDDPLDLVLLFSSLAARTGRRGQADAAMANEVLNKIASSEHFRRGNDCLVKAFNWSHWESGGHADSAETAPEEALRIPVDVGARMLVEELQAGLPDQVEVILGHAPQPASVAMLTMDAFVSAATHPFLEGYRMGGVPVLPLSLVLEWFTRITRAHCPDLEMISCRELKALRTVRLGKFYEGGDAFTIVSQQLQRGSGRELRLELYARDGSLRFTATADLSRPGTLVSASDETARLIRGTHVQDLRRWPFSSIYGHALFQGPECQVIREIEGISDDGMVAVLAGAREMGWANSWRTDLAALDGGLQLAVLWFQQKLGGTAQPVAVQSYRSYFSGLVEGPIRVYLRGQHKGFQRVLCDVAFVNENKTLVGELRGVEVRAHIKPAVVPEPDVWIDVEDETAGEVPVAEEAKEEAAEAKEEAAEAEEVAAEDIEEEVAAEPPAREAAEEPVEAAIAGEEEDPGDKETARDNGTRTPLSFSPAWQDKATRIAATIDALLAVPHSNAQLLFRAKGLGELVRFVGGEGKLYMDLPEKFLGPERMPRAEKYFAAVGVEKESTELYEAGRLAGRFESFGLELGGDTGRATQIALDLFSEVYLLRDDFQLEIQES